MLTGNEALARAVGASRLRASYGFAGLPLHRLAESLATRPPAAFRHHPAHSDLQAAALAIGGALLSGGGTALLLRAGGVNVALEALATLGLMNELRSPQLIVAGFDPGPQSAATAQDDRHTLAYGCQLAQLDPGSPDEVYHMARLAVQASRLAGMPICLRTGSRVLDMSAEVHETPADPHGGGVSIASLYARSAGPYVMASATYRYHSDKREHRLQQLEALSAALCTETSGGGRAGVILAGHLGPRVQARLLASHLPSLRLGATWPLPRGTIERFLRGHDDVLVLEEGQRFLEREIRSIAHDVGLTCRVRGSTTRTPLRLDDESLDSQLRPLGVAAGPHPVVERDLAGWRRVQEALIAIRPIDMEPWPLFLARARKKLWGFATNDPRAQLLAAIRAVDRPTVVVADPSAAALLGFRDRLIDVKGGFGQAPSIAGALSEASGLEERGGALLSVALLGDINLYQSSLLGIVDNVTSRRDVLHVILVREEASGAADNAVPVGVAIEGQLRAFGVPFLTTRLGEAGVDAALKTMVAESGPRALVCLGSGREETIGG